MKKGVYNLNYNKYVKLIELTEFNVNEDINIKDFKHGIIIDFNDSSIRYIDNNIILTHFDCITEKEFIDIK